MCRNRCLSEFGTGYFYVSSNQMSYFRKLIFAFRSLSFIIFEILADLFLHSLVVVNGQYFKNLAPIQHIQVIEMIILANVNSIQESTLRTGDRIGLGMLNTLRVA